MLNLICRPAAPLARARYLWVAAPWACVWILSSPVAHAAEAAPADLTTSPPFNHYQSWRDEPLQDWREANARVGEIGGWRIYLRESQESGGAAASGKPGGNHGQHGE